MANDYKALLKSGEKVEGETPIARKIRASAAKASRSVCDIAKLRDHRASRTLPNPPTSFTSCKTRARVISSLCISFFFSSFPSLRSFGTDRCHFLFFVFIYLFGYRGQVLPQDSHEIQTDTRSLVPIFGFVVCRLSIESFGENFNVVYLFIDFFLF